MYLTNGLYNLIKGLSANEKKYFFQFIEITGRENKIYYDLYRVINDTDSLDEEYLRSKFGASYGGNLGMLKEKLYEQILNALHNFYREDKADHRIIKWTQDAKLLIHKGIFRLALKKIDKAISHSTNYDRYLLIMHLIGLKKTILIHTQFDSTTQGDIEDLQNFEKKMTVLLDTIREANNDQLLYYFYISKNENELATKIARKVQQKLQKTLPISAQTIYLNITAHEYETNGDMIRATKQINSHIELLSSDKNYLKEYYGNYLLQSFNLIYLLLYQNEIVLAAHKLNFIKQEITDNRIYKHLMLSLYYSNMFLLHIFHKNLTNLDRDIAAMQLDYKKLKREVPPNLTKHTIYCRACILLAIKDYKRCVQYLLISLDIIATLDYVFYKFWLLLICCYIHLKDVRGIQYAANQFKSYLKYGNEYYKEDSFIKHYCLHENLVIIKPKAVLKALKSKPSNKELYFPFNLMKEF